MKMTCPLPIDWLEFIETGRPSILEAHLAECRSCEELVSVLTEARGETLPDWRSRIDLGNAVTWQPARTDEWSFGDLALSRSSFSDGRTSYEDIDRVLLVVLDEGEEQDGRRWHRVAPVETNTEIAGETDLLLSPQATQFGLPIRVILSFQLKVEASQLDERVSRLTAEGRDVLQGALHGDLGDEHFGVALRGPDDPRVELDQSLEELLRALRAPFFAAGEDEEVGESAEGTSEQQFGHVLSLADWVSFGGGGDVEFFELKWREAADDAGLALAADTTAVESVLEASLSAHFGQMRGRLQFEWDAETLVFVVEDLQNFLANEMTLVVEALGKVLISDPFKPHPGAQIPIGPKGDVVEQDVDRIAAKVR